MRAGKSVLFFLSLAFLSLQGYQLHEITDSSSLTDSENLVEIEAAATEGMTVEMEAEAKKNFMHLATSFRRSTSGTMLDTIRLARSAFLGEQVHMAEKQAPAKMEENSALDLIFEKLDEMKREINEESKDELEKITEMRAQCRTEIAESSAIVEAKMQERNVNSAVIKTDAADILKLWAKWHAFWKGERDAHKEVHDIQAERQAACDIVSVEVDERNKAIDVLIKAIFIVCEKFPRYKQSQQCLEIQSQPDVIEPDRINTKPSAEAKLETELSHTLPEGTPPDQAPRWLKKWTRTLLKDRTKEGVKDPEGLLVNEEHRLEVNAQWNEAEKTQDEPLSRLYQNNFNDRGDTALSEDKTYDYVLENGYKCELTGWTHSRQYAKGFLRRTAGKAQAVVKGLIPGRDYAYKVYQYASEYAGTNQLSVNGASEVATTSTDSENAAAEGITKATDAGQIVFEFTRSPGSGSEQVHLSGIAIGRKGPPELKSAAVLAESNQHQQVADLGEDDALLTHHSASSREEAQAHAQLTTLLNSATLPQKYRMPIADLVVMLNSGRPKKKRSKSIVNVLLECLQEIRQIQDDAVAAHTIRLNQWYKDIDSLVDGLMSLRKDEQFDAKTGIMHYQTKISDLQVLNEHARIDQNRAWANRISWEDRCTKAEEEYSDGDAMRVDDLENIMKLKSLLRGIYNKNMPKACPKFAHVLCTTKDNGWCIFTKVFASGGDSQRCSCNPEFYGEACQYRKCPGFANTLYLPDADGACSNRGSCDKFTGECTCRKEFYHGPKNACEYKHAPPSRNGKVDNKCTEENGISRGIIDKVRGMCNCGIEYYGPGCEERRCPHTNGILYPAVSGNACNGHGSCNVDDGVCECHGHYFNGDKKACEAGTCDLACKHHGTCNYHTAECVCDEMSYGQFCQHRFCPNMIDVDCSGGGKCNRNNGMCICKMGFSGPICSPTARCEAAQLNNAHMNWWTVWDKPGWLLCEKGQLMYKLERSKCSTLPDPKNDPLKAPSTGGALSCIESGGCSAPCEELDDYVFQIRHCYHTLRMYNEFDFPGWAKCRSDYFVAGLYRSCESLYCLNMMKCCSLSGGEAYHYSHSGTREVFSGPDREKKIEIPLGNTHHTRWYNCGTAAWGTEFNGETDEQLIGKVPEGVYITGFKRGEGHTLANIEAASYCGFIRGY
jgi:hypothetical protein